MQWRNDTSWKGMIMEKICLMTDSASDLTREMAQEFDIRVLPVTITYAGAEHKEFEEIDVFEYWDFLEENEELPTTAQITPAQYLEAFDRARQDGYEKIIAVLINGNGSGTYASGIVARDLYYSEHGQDMEICLIDSKNYTIAYGKSLILARQAIVNGAGFEEVVRLIEDHVSRVEAAAAVFSLRQLRKSGRINGAAACVGELLGIKPLIHLCNGGVDVVDKVRGEKAVVSGIIRKVSDRVVQSEKQNALLLYGDVPAARIEELEKRLFTELGFMGVTRCPIGVSVITNTGPQALAVAFYGRGRT